MDKLSEITVENIKKDIPEFNSGDTVSVHVKILKRGKVRRAKLFYLRKLKGKATKIKEKK